MATTSNATPDNRSPREQFFDWLATCPVDQYQESDDYGETVIRFSYPEAPDEGSEG